MSSFNRNSDCDLTQSPTAASAMTQPARRTFLPGHVVVIICSITIQLLNLARTIHLERYERSYNKTATFAYLGLLYFSYIADVCLTRYRTLKCSFIFLIVGCTMGLLLSLVLTSVVLVEILAGKIDLENANSIVLVVISTTTGIVITTGVGLFEANALQFGLDQLLEAPTPKLIAFIHWYYWTHNAVQLVVMYITAGWTPLPVA